MLKGKYNEDLPDELFRGLSTLKECVSDDKKYVYMGAFQFSSNARQSDGHYELSINWNDNEEALRILREQHKPHDTKLQFAAGYCTLEKKVLRHISEVYEKDEYFDYERREILASPEEDILSNPYHGNLLLRTENKKIKQNIQGVLATNAVFHEWDE